ncbi:MAG: hypothetical protein AB1671_01770 [Thermodesulfobacteriota bacterium]
MPSSVCWVRVCLCTMFCFATAANAGINQWTGNGPEGGTVWALAIDPVNPTTLYAATAGNGVFKSTDGGRRWTAINAGLADLFVTTLALDPLAPSTIYAGTWGAVFKSVDGGAHWTRASLNFLGSVTALVIDPTAPHVLYATTEAFGQSTAIFKSTDGGETWVRKVSFVGALVTLAIDPVNPTTLFAGGGSALLKTTDGGESWTNIGDSFPPGGGIRTLAIDPVDSETLYAGTNTSTVSNDRLFEGGGVLKSTDGGVTWTATNFPDLGVSIVRLDPTNPAILYAGTTGSGVFKSTDRGMNWAAMNNGLRNLRILTLAVDPAMSMVVYVGTEGDGVSKSVDGGTNWGTANRGVINTYVRAVALDPTDPAIIYAGTAGNGVFRSTDRGANWVPTNDGLGSLLVAALALDPVTPTTLYAGTYDKGIFKSTDSGMRWVPVNDGLPSTDEELSVSDLTIDPTSPQTLYAVVNGKVFQSNTGGVVWLARSTGLSGFGVEDLAIDPQTPTTLYASAKEGVFKSTNGGVSWSLMEEGLELVDIFSLVLDPTDSTVLYAGTNGGIFKSTDAGESWVPGGLAAFVTALTMDPTNPTVLYAGVRPSAETEGGVFGSADGGATWVSMNAGLTNPAVAALAIEPATGSTLYAGTEGGGVFDFQLTDTPPGGILAYFESPEPGPVSGIAVVRGWAFAAEPDVRIEQVEFFIDGERGGAIPCCSQRADVRAAFPQFPAENTLDSGWGAVVNWGWLSPGPHTVQVRIEGSNGALFFSEVRTITAVKPGDYEFLDQFDLSRAQVRVEGDELVVEGVVVRDKATQQQKVVNTRFRWFAHSQSFGMVHAETVMTLSAWRSLTSSLFAALPTWCLPGPPSARAQSGFPAVAAVFESPADGQVVSGIGIIRGWTFSDRGAVPIGLAIDGHPMGLIPCCSERADVAAAFPDNPHALHSGWGAVFNYGLLGAGPHTIEVGASFYGYSGPIDMHTVTVVKPGGFEFLDQFDLSTAQAAVSRPWATDLHLAGVRVRDKATQQTTTIDVQLRWFEHSQALGLVGASQ